MKVSFRICLTAAIVIILGAAAASAQDVYKVNYFDNARFANFAAFGSVRIDNPGLTYGNLCAMIYVFKADQQLSECCGCIASHNGLRKLSLFSDLSSNPVAPSGGLLLENSGVIKVVSSAVNGPASTCDPTSGVTPKANLRVWVTHVQGYVTVPAVIPIVTETESSDSPLGAMELTSLQAQCAFINILGSGQGICTCGTGD
jgi:hypothetical protein